MTPNHYNRFPALNDAGLRYMDEEALREFLYETHNKSDGILQVNP